MATIHRAATRGIEEHKIEEFERWIFFPQISVVTASHLTFITGYIF